MVETRTFMTVVLVGLATPGLADEVFGPPVPARLRGPSAIGQVFNHLGGGVNGAEITARTKPGDGQPPKLLHQTTSDGLGDFKVQLPRGTQGTIEVTIRMAGFTPFTREYDVADMGNDDFFIEALLQGGRKLTGRVIDGEDQHPVAEATVVASVGGREIIAETDDDGRFEISGLPPGKGLLRIRAEGYGRTAETIDTEAIEKPVEVTLEVERVLHLRVIDDRKQPVDNALIELVPDDDTGRRSIRTDAEGYAGVNQLGRELESIRVRVTHEDCVRTGQFDQEIIPDTGELAPRVTLTLVRGGAIHGRIVGPDGEPLFGARIQASNTQAGYVPAQFSDGEGNYRLGGVPQGVAVLTIYHSFHAPQLLEVKVEPGRVTELDVTMTTGRTTGGTVVDPNGNALADVRIVLADWKGHRTLRLGAITDESGLFAIENAPDEEIRFSLSTPEIPDIKEVILKPGRTDHRIELDPAAAPTPPAGAPGQPRQVGPAFAPGIVAPDFTVTTLAGENLTLKDLRGKFVFVDFWATWCPPCVAELPMVKRLHQAMATRDDFLLLSISLDREPATVRAFVKQRNIAWPQVVGETAGATHTATAYQVNSIPSTFLIGPDGAILATDLRGEGLVDAVRRHVDATK